MAYNPGIQDRSGQILAASYTNAANTITGAATKAIGDYQAKRKETDFMRSTLEEIARTNPELVDEEKLAKFESGSAGAKQGIFTSAGAAFSQYSEQIAEENRNQAKLAQIREAARIRSEAARDAPRYAPEPFDMGGMSGVYNPMNGTVYRADAPDLPQQILEPEVLEIDGVKIIYNPNNGSSMLAPTTDQPGYVPPQTRLLKPNQGEAPGSMSPQTRLLKPNQGTPSPLSMSPSSDEEINRILDEIGIPPIN